MGGYRLAKAPSEITVREILESAEGSLVPVSCMDNTPNLCKKCEDCITITSEILDRKGDCRA